MQWSFILIDMADLAHQIRWVIQCHETNLNKNKQIQQAKERKQQQKQLLKQYLKLMILFTCNTNSSLTANSVNFS